MEFRTFKASNPKHGVLVARVVAVEVEQGRMGWAVRIEQTRSSGKSYMALVTPRRVSKDVALLDLKLYHPRAHASSFWGGVNTWIDTGNETE